MRLKTIQLFTCAILVAGFFLGCELPYDTTPIRTVNLTKIDSSADQVTVDARAGWVRTGVNVRAGQKVHFSASGIWGESPGVSRSADGGEAGMFGSGYWGVMRPLPTAPWGALLGRVGSSVFMIGIENDLAMPQDGDLMLGINDGQGNDLLDNHGALTVIITRE